jgi:two-component system, chemotaxis family, protein-glutamate methylesterase/glutaminase
VSGGVVVVGASAGGVEALRALVGGLPVGLPAPVVVVLHIPRHAPSALAAILARSGPLPARTAEHRAPLLTGVVHVAPADRHVLVTREHVHLSAGPEENGHRPAVDPLFRSAAVAFGSGAVGVVLSGTRDDGTAGAVALAGRGGPVLVQELDEALYGAMPRNVLTHVPEARALPAAKIGAEVAELLDAARGRGDPASVPAGLLLAEDRIAASVGGPGAAELEEAAPSGLSCPSCDGSLFALPGHPAPRFRCRVGHAWSPDSLAAEQDSGVDDAMWVALRALEERVALLAGLAAEADRHGLTLSAENHRRRAAEVRRDVRVVRDLLDRPWAGPGG